MVAGAVAGDDLESVAATVAHAVECPVAIAIPAHGPPVVSPSGSLSDEATAAIVAHANALGAGYDADVPAAIAEAVPVRIGEQVVGIVAATAGHASAERRAWLEAAAAAASVTALIRDAPGRDSGGMLIAELTAGASNDIAGLLNRARRLGVDLSLGVVALSARGEAAHAAMAASGRKVLVAELRPGRVVAIAAASADAGPIAELATTLRARGMIVAISAPRRDPALLHEAIREAELLAELGASEGTQPNGHDETYRLLIGVLLRDRAELEQLRDSTVASLQEYDARHDTELGSTLCAFLAHDGSTTETAEAMQLHRHTVGYRLSRVQEVSGLSPYESDGRERLSLGIKAQQILDADRRLDAGQPRR
jgi:PucR-like helix-turn-helix protein/diguanylate cyclase with GGDEF domain